MFLLLLQPSPSPVVVVRQVPCVIHRKEGAEGQHFARLSLRCQQKRELEERVGGRVGDISSCCLCEVFVESLRRVRELIADCAGCSAALTLCAQRNSRSVFSPISTLKGHVTDQTPRTLTDASSSIIFEK